MTTAGGLTAGELELVTAELAAVLRGARVADVVRPAGRDDLVLWLETAGGRSALQVALGSGRARVAITQRRWRRDELQSGPRLDRLREQLAGAQFVAAVQPAGERRCSLVFRHPERGRCSVEMELFGARGLWALLDGGGRIVELSRLPESKDRTLRPGEVYAPPAGANRGREPEPRFAPPVLAAIDAAFTALDLASEEQERRQRVQTALERAERSLAQRIAGLEQQQVQAQEAPALRRRADLLLAYSSRWRRGEEALVVPDPDLPDQQLRIPVDPQIPLPKQAEKLYARARTLAGALQIGAERLAAARAQQQRVAGWCNELASADDARVVAMADELQAAGLLRAAPSPPVPKPSPGAKRAATGPRLRQFTSAEGLQILCGRTNEQNDQLSIRIARGNDLWFHVGGGRAGSHVVVRLPKGRTASLETMLDAAAVAVHFSKARGETLCEVVYTLAKHVRKPKGLPPGKVTITQEKSLRVRLEPERLRRLLDSAPIAERD